jgi:parallel beta-helix repeat protein
MMKQSILLFAAFCLAALAVDAKKVYVSTTTGVDIFSGGTLAQPFKTIGFAVQQALAKDSVVVQTGIYNETAEIYINKALTLTAFDYNPVIIDAAARGTGSNKYMLGIINTDSVTINFIQFRNCIGNGSKGIWVLGAGKDIIIQNCALQNIGWINNNITAVAPNSSFACNAIRIEGNAADSLHRVIVRNNTISYCATGWGEALTFTGNVSSCAIDQNVIHHIANIGMVMAGNYRYGSGPPTARNQTRYCLITRNTVYNCISPIKVNAGIYLDGALNCLVEGNHCFQNCIGISLGGEENLEAGILSIGKHVLRNNIIHSNSIAGIFAGSTNASNTVDTCTIINNTLYKNRTGRIINNISSIDNQSIAALSNEFGGDVFLFNTKYLQFYNNIIYPSLTKRAIITGSTSVIVEYLAANNLYFQDDNAPLFQISSGSSFNGNTGLSGYYFSIAQFNTATNTEQNSVFGNPGFVNASLNDFQLSSTALAIDKGLASAALSTVDFALQTRVVNSTVDAGAYEWQTAAALPFTYTFIGNGNWNIASNWQFGQIPPLVLPGSQAISINPIVGGRAVLQQTQVLSAGASLTVQSGKQLLVVDSLVRR